MGKFEQAVQEQILEEYPQFEGKTMVHTESGREFNLERLTHHVCGKMWDTFDETLFNFETKDNDGLK